MSYEDLEEHNIFLPEEHWDELDLSSSVNQPLLLLTILIGLLACTLMVLGSGESLTWMGAGLFIIFLYAFTLVSNTGIDNQNRTVDEVMEEDD
ncbi:MAG: hypothetical protein K9N46_03655 [Candidatus Marinimicrobia bacterium]|nr:hypothetical protein [Candidatus Neomarinimicrobiota bacterium]MCF7829658.1 hypothetical protein [Candidatus Neomarinimicrobiota bacterium]MCF7879818.1 hypothetical protein [Candidatus Neomarinimicrobiota bacterium]